MTDNVVKLQVPPKYLFTAEFYEERGDIKARLVDARTSLIESGSTAEVLEKISNMTAAGARDFLSQSTNFD